MPKDTLAANATSTPTNRRGFLRSAIAASVIATPVAVLAAADEGNPDAALFDLIERWHAASKHYANSATLFEEAEFVVSRIKPPPALYVTQFDKDWIIAIDEKVGEAYHRRASLEVMDRMLIIAARYGFARDELARVAERAGEIAKAYREHTAAIELAKNESQFVALEAEKDAALAVEESLRRDLTNARPRTLKGLLAKAAAIAEQYDLASLSQDTQFADADETPSFEWMALSAVRDGAELAEKGIGNV